MRDEQGIPVGVHELAELVSYQDGGIVSRLIFKNEGGSVTVFAFDRGQSISEHTVAFEAAAMVIDGAGEIQVNGVKSEVPTGSIIRMPAGAPHAVSAPQRFKMVLFMARARID